MCTTRFARFLFLGVLFLCLQRPICQALRVNEYVNQKPVVGILAQETDGVLSQYGKYYIAASYVKWVEAAGARVVPLWYANYSTSELQSLLSKLNGVLFPGGGSSMSGKYNAVLQQIYNFTLQENAAGNPFVLWGTCQGFEQMMILASGNYSILSQFDAENFTIPLELLPQAETSRLFGWAPEEVIATITTESVTMNNHAFGLAPASFKASANLASYFSLLSINYDREKRYFVSSVEHVDYPIYAVQWHPEKNEFEWNHEVINHSPDAVASMEYFGWFFVNECRRNRDKFSSEEELDTYLIYNFAPVYTGLVDDDFVQCYFQN